MGQEQTVLGFDYGERRIGVAVGQSVTTTATPLQVVPVYRNRPDWQMIDIIIHRWQPDCLIVGAPLNMDGSRQWMTDKAERFARQLQGRSGIPALLAEERLSTVAARERMRDPQCGSSASEYPDALAAQIIIENWFAQQLQPKSSV